MLIDNIPKQTQKGFHWSNELGKKSDQEKLIFFIAEPLVASDMLVQQATIQSFRMQHFPNLLNHIIFFLSKNTYEILWNYAVQNSSHYPHVAISI